MAHITKENRPFLDAYLRRVQSRTSRIPVRCIHGEHFTVYENTKIQWKELGDCVSIRQQVCCKVCSKNTVYEWNVKVFPECVTIVLEVGNASHAR